MLRTNLLLLILFFALVISTKAQGYTPFSDSSGFWKVDHSDCGGCHIPGTNCLCGISNYTLSGDTIIGAFLYQKIYNIYQEIIQVYPGGINTYPRYYVGALRNDTSNKKVFFIPENSINDTLLYDFNINLGDTLPQTYLHSSSEILKVDSIDTLILNGHSYKRYHIYQSPLPWIRNGHALIEGIGSTYGLLEQQISLFEVDNNLICFKYSNDSLVYDLWNVVGGSPMSDCDVLTEVVNLNEEKFQLSIFPNPISESSILIIEVNESTTFEVRIYNSLGTQIKKHTNIKNVVTINKKDFKPGVYFVEVIRDNSSIKSVKFVVN